MVETVVGMETKKGEHQEDQGSAKNVLKKISSDVITAGDVE